MRSQTFSSNRRSDFTAFGGLEAEALEVLRLVIRHTERGENLDADLVERARAIVERYDKAMMGGHEAPGVVPLRKGP